MGKNTNHQLEAEEWRRSARYRRRRDRIDQNIRIGENSHIGVTASGTLFFVFLVFLTLN